MVGKYTDELIRQIKDIALYRVELSDYWSKKINNGTIRGQDILARASNDLKNLSGSITGTGAASTVTLLAERDMVLQTRTMDSSVSTKTLTSSRTTIDRVAQVQGGTVTLAAARDLLATGAQVKADGDVNSSAGRDITIKAVQG